MKSKLFKSKACIKYFKIGSEYHKIKSGVKIKIKLYGRPNYNYKLFMLYNLVSFDIYHKLQIEANRDPLEYLIK